MDSREGLQNITKTIGRLAEASLLKAEERGLGEVEKKAGRLQRRKRTREASHDEQRRELPRLAFEQAKFENWQRRVEGLETELST